MLTDFFRVPEQDNISFDGLKHRRGNVGATHESLGTDNEANEESDFFSTFLGIANERDSGSSKSDEESVSTGAQRNQTGDGSVEVKNRPDTQPDTQKLIGEKEEPAIHYGKATQVLEAKIVDESTAGAPEKKTRENAQDEKGGELPVKSGSIKGMNAGKGQFSGLESGLIGQVIVTGAKNSKDSSPLPGALSVKRNPGVTGRKDIKGLANLKEVYEKVNAKGIERQAGEGILSKRRNDRLTGESVGKEVPNLKEAYEKVNAKGIEKQSGEGILSKRGNDRPAVEASEKEIQSLKGAYEKVNVRGIEKQAGEGILSKKGNDRPAVESSGKEVPNLKEAYEKVNVRGIEKQSGEGVLSKGGNDRLKGESVGKEAPNLRRAHGEYARLPDQGSGQEPEKAHIKAKVNSPGLNGPDERQILNTKEILARGETLTSRGALFPSEKEKAGKKGARPAQETLSSREIGLKSNSNNSRSGVYLDQGSRGDNTDQGKRDPRFKLSSISQPQEASESSKGNPKDQAGGGTETRAENDRSIKFAAPASKRFNEYLFDRSIPKPEINSGENSTLTASNPSPSAKTTGASSHLGEMEMIKRSFQENGLRQLVEKAALNLRNGKSEVRIELKPELLGQVRMQISTDNHQVTIRILAALPIAKEMIENNLHQLKAELQSHGLEIEKFEVSLSKGNDRNGAENDTPGSRKMKKGSGQKRDSRVASDLEMGKTDQVENRNTGANGVDLFA